MTDETDRDPEEQHDHDETNSGDEPSEEDEIEIVVDRIEYDVETTTPTAGDLMERAGAEPGELDQYQLIALDGPSDEGGQRDTVFHHNDEVDLTEPNRRHFRNIPKGNPRASPLS